MSHTELVPLSQSVLLSIYPKERQGFAMALFGMGVMAGPILGPVIGGWLTENYSWRYVFYINLPVGILAYLGMTAFLRSRRECGTASPSSRSAEAPMAASARTSRRSRSERY